MKIRERLLSKLHDFDYRHAYVDDFTDAFIATQIKVLREQNNLTQEQLADLAGMKQSQISGLEDVNTRSWKVSTLKKIAKALDLALVVRFESFGKILPDIGRLDRETLQRTSFKDDPVFAPATIVTEANTSNDRAIADLPKGGVLLNASARFFAGKVSNVA